MDFTPSTVVNVLNVPLNLSNKNQIDFASTTDQASYFSSCLVRSFTDFTYQRKDNIIRVPVNAEHLYNCNYVMYQNNNFSGKWFYAYITKIEYLNPDCTALHIKTDVFQTWFYDCTFRPSFIVRETVLDDSLFKHTIPENIESGEKIVQSIDTTSEADIRGHDFLNFDETFYCVVAMSEPASWWQGFEVPPLDNFMSGLPNCCYFYAMSRDVLYNFFKELNTAGQAGAVVSCVAIPKCFVEYHQMPFENVGYITDVATPPEGFTKSIAKNLTSLNGYIPKNKKCFCYPYNFVILSNNCGASTLLKYELFDDKEGDMIFNTWYTAGTAPCLTSVPRDYNGVHLDFNYSIAYNNFPELAWKYDSYANWLALNKNSLAMSYIAKGIGMAGNIASANIPGVLSDTIGIASDLASMADRSKVPEQYKGQVSPNVPLQADRANCFVYQYCCRAEYAQIVDEYFSRFGYLVNEVKKPNLKNRVNWDYIQTRAVDISGSVPNDDMLELCSLFDSGLTIWHNTATYGDYGTANPTVL